MNITEKTDQRKKTEVPQGAALIPKFLQKKCRETGINDSDRSKNGEIGYGFERQSKNGFKKIFQPIAQINRRSEKAQRNRRVPVEPIAYECQNGEDQKIADQMMDFF